MGDIYKATKFNVETQYSGDIVVRPQWDLEVQSRLIILALVSVITFDIFTTRTHIT